jgi:hypothetical protein
MKGGEENAEFEIRISHEILRYRNDDEQSM